MTTRPDAHTSTQESHFHASADDWLEHLFESLERQDDEAALDIDFGNGIVEITINAEQVFIISKHAPSRQLWLSSPLSGGHHFDKSKDTGGWVLKDGRSLSVVLSEELRQCTGQDFVL